MNMFYKFGFFVFVFMIFSIVVSANLDAEPFSDIDGFHLNILQTGVGDTATLGFSSQFDEIFDDNNTLLDTRKLILN